MRALSIKQPLATAVVRGDRLYMDVRSPIAPNCIGPLLIHGSAAWHPMSWQKRAGAKRHRCIYDMGLGRTLHYAEPLGRGALIGYVQLVTVRRDEFANAVRYVLQFEDPHEFKRPVPWHGAAPFWNVYLESVELLAADGHIVDELRELLEREDT